MNIMLGASHGSYDYFAGQGERGNAPLVATGSATEINVY